MRFLKDIIASSNTTVSSIKDFLKSKYFINQQNKSIDVFFSVCHKEIEMVDFQSFLDALIHHLQFTTNLISFIHPSFRATTEEYQTNFSLSFCYENEEKLREFFEYIKKSKDRQGIIFLKRKEKDYKFESVSLCITKTTGSVETIFDREVEKEITFLFKTSGD